MLLLLLLLLFCFVALVYIQFLDHIENLEYLFAYIICEILENEQKLLEIGDSNTSFLFCSIFEYNMLLYIENINSTKYLKFKKSFSSSKLTSYD